MRTTSKCFKEQVQNHIIDGLDPDENFETLPEKLLSTIIDFTNWYGAYEQRNYPKRQEAFTSWLDGLPSSLSTEFEYYKVHQTMKSWWENCGETYKYKEPTDKEYQLYKNLIYREFQTLCKQNDVKF